MNVLLSFYYSLPKLENRFLIYKAFIRGIAKVIKLYLDWWYPIFLNKKGSKPSLNENSGKPENEKVIASLTSFPARIKYTFISIECLLRQSVKPDRIILWLAEEQFPNKTSDLPENLVKLTDRGLEIKFCEDLRSHKKYYYSLSNNPKNKVIMFDDDLYYHKDIVKHLIEHSKKHPKYITASRVHKMKFKDAELLPYRNWTHNYQTNEPGLNLLHTSGNGTLIPTKEILDDILFDKSLILDLSPNSDDVWWKINLIRLGIKVSVFNKYNRDPVTVKSTHQNSLVSSNTFKGGKDLQIKNTANHFGIKFKKDKHSL
ncbi:hypothetical protein [Brumimicrobium mesophilum]|uniref:hypothetical protein n=1 Tax=Brumimicrobium mesophilum TaxID=392717 RepID=UPI000D141E1A|nr:hypothetical protein [Brumimicrobium mesophilum]